MPEHTEQGVGTNSRFRFLIVALISTAVGAALTLLLVRNDQSPKALGIAPEKFIPAQTLQLLDGRQQYLGDLALTTDGVAILSVADAKGAPLFMYTTGVNTPMLTIFGCQDSLAPPKPCSLDISMEPELSFDITRPGAKSIFTQGKGWTANTGFFVGLLKLAYESAFPQKPENTVEKMIPSEDVRLVDRQHHVLAVFGLSEAGEPSIALNTSTGRLAAIFAITEADFATGGSKEWPTLLLFDRHGMIRITLALGPAPEPSLSISEKPDPKTSDLGAYALDPETGREISVHLFDQKATAIPWLSHPMPRVVLPISLVDQRGGIVWHSS